MRTSIPGCCRSVTWPITAIGSRRADVRTGRCRTPPTRQGSRRYDNQPSGRLRQLPWFTVRYRRRLQMVGLVSGGDSQCRRGRHRRQQVLRHHFGGLLEHRIGQPASRPCWAWMLGLGFSPTELAAAGFDALSGARRFPSAGGTRSRHRIRRVGLDFRTIRCPVKAGSLACVRQDAGDPAAPSRIDCLADSSAASASFRQPVGTGAGLPTFGVLGDERRRSRWHRPQCGGS